MRHVDLSSEAELELFEAALHFPYGIFFSVDEEVVLVLAILHLHRQPGAWKKRKLTP